MKLPMTSNYSSVSGRGEQRSLARRVLYWFACFTGSPELAARFREPQPRPLTLGEGDSAPTTSHDDPGGSAPSWPGPFLTTGGRKVFRRIAAGMRLAAGDAEVEAN
jgi:hypothetical protein